MTNQPEVLDMPPKEWIRLQGLIQYEQEARAKGFQLIAGVDEAGRGPLAGPVVAAACVIPSSVFIPGVDDSKKLSSKARQEIVKIIQADERVKYGIGIVEAGQIDRVNIYQATIQAMLIAIFQLDPQPDCLLVDGMSLPHPTLPCVKIIKGDSLSQSIAAASIIAKETRDQLMRGYHEQWPCYGFDQHKGYGTVKHLEALRAYGPCDIHRLSFRPCKQAANE